MKLIFTRSVLTGLDGPVSVEVARKYRAELLKARDALPEDSLLREDLVAAAIRIRRALVDAGYSAE